MKENNNKEANLLATGAQLRDIAGAGHGFLASDYRGYTNLPDRDWKEGGSCIILHLEAKPSITFTGETANLMRAVVGEPQVVTAGGKTMEAGQTSAHTAAADPPARRRPGRKPKNA